MKVTVEGDCMQFTACMWKSKEPTGMSTRGSKTGKVTVAREEAFPDLDMALKWNQENELTFGVHIKPNQQIQKGSMHTKACLEAIPEGVFNRLGKLTTITEATKNLPVDRIYPRHVHKLQQAQLINQEAMPTIEDIRKLAETKAGQDHQQEKRESQRKREKKIFFVVSYSRAWTTPIHQIIKEEKKKFELEWISVSIEHTRFSNLREILQHDLTNKVNQYVKSLDFMNRDCNCSPDPQTGTVICRRKTVVCGAKCKKHRIQMHWKHPPVPEEEDARPQQ